MEQPRVACFSFGLVAVRLCVSGLGTSVGSFSVCQQSLRQACSSAFVSSLIPLSSTSHLVLVAGRAQEGGTKTHMES
jgi:hypothetical protein